MKVSFIIAGMILVYIVLGGIAAELGLTEPIISAAVEVPDAPSGSGSLWDKIAASLAPFSWAFNAVAGLFQLATYQSEDVPPLVNTFIFLPMGLVLLFAGIKIIRG